MYVWSESLLLISAQSSGLETRLGSQYAGDMSRDSKPLLEQVMLTPKSLTVPAPGAGFPTSHNVAIHFANPQCKTPNCRYYPYSGVEAGFAEMDREQYDKVCASLAGSRSLAVLRKGFEIKVDLKEIWDDYVACESFCLEGLAMKQLTSGLEEVEFVRCRMYIAETIFPIWYCK